MRTFYNLFAALIILQFLGVSGLSAQKYSTEELSVFAAQTDKKVDKYHMRDRQSVQKKEKMSGTVYEKVELTANGEIEVLSLLRETESYVTYADYYYESGRLIHVYQHVSWFKVFSSDYSNEEFGKEERWFYLNDKQVYCKKYLTYPEPVKTVFAKLDGMMWKLKKEASGIRNYLEGKTKVFPTIDLQRRQSTTAP